MSEKISYKAFSASIKAKYPEYSEVDDLELSTKMIEKYPEYADRVTLTDNSDFMPGGKMSLVQPSPTTPLRDQTNFLSNKAGDNASASLSSQSPITEGDKMRLGSFPVQAPTLNLEDKPAGQFYKPLPRQTSLYNPRLRENDMTGLTEEKTADTRPALQKEFIAPTGESIKQGHGAQETAIEQSAEYLANPQEQAKAQWELLQNTPQKYGTPRKDQFGNVSWDLTADDQEYMNSLFDQLPESQQVEEWKKNPEKWNDRPFIQQFRTVADSQKSIFGDNWVGDTSLAVGNVVEALNAGGAAVGGGLTEFIHQNIEKPLFGWVSKDPSSRLAFGRLADVFFEDQAYSSSAAGKHNTMDENGNIRQKDFTDYIKEGDFASALGDLSLGALESAPTSAVAIGATMAGSPQAGLAIIGAQVAGSRKRELDATHPGLSEFQKNLIAYGSGAIEAGSEMLGDIPIGKMLGKIYKTGGTAVAENVMKNSVEAIIQNTTKQLKNGSILWKAPLMEGGEEFVSGVGNYLLDSANGLQQFNMSEMIGQSAKQMAYGAVAGGGFGLVGTPGLIRNAKVAKELQTLKSQYDIANSNMQNAFADSEFEFEGEKIITLPLAQQQEILPAVYDAENLSDEQKTAIRDYMEAGNKLNAALVNVGLTNIELLRKKANAFKQVQESINDKTGKLDVITIQGTADTQQYNVKSGTVVLDNEGKVDTQNSDEAIYYYTGAMNEDGTPEVNIITPESISELTQLDPKEELKSRFTEIEAEEFVRSEFGEGMQIQVNTDAGLLPATVVAVTPTGLVANVQGQEVELSFTQSVEDVEAVEQPISPKEEQENQSSTYAPGTSVVVNGTTFVVGEQDEEGNYFINDENGQQIDRFTPEEMAEMGFSAAVTPTEAEQQPITLKEEYETAPVTPETTPVQQYPVNKKGEIDFDAMTVPQTYQYMVDNYGQQEAVEALQLQEKNTQAAIQVNIKATDKFKSGQYAEVKKATTIQEQLKIREKHKATAQKLTDERAVLDAQLAEIRALMPQVEQALAQPEVKPVTSSNVRPEEQFRREQEAKAQEEKKTPELSIEEKKSDIERRRQEELISKYRIADELNNNETYLINRAKINAKYDAELAALEAAPEVEPIAETEQQPVIEVRAKQKNKSIINPWQKRLNNLGDAMTIEDVVLRRIAGGAKFVWTANAPLKGMADELGFANKSGERELRKSMIDNENGMTPQEFAHAISESGDIDFMGEVDGQDVYNAVIDVLLRVNSATDAMEMAERLRDSRDFSMNEQAEWNSITPEEANYLESIPDDILESYLGITNFSPEQLDIIQNLQNGYYGTTNTTTTETSAVDSTTGIESEKTAAGTTEGKLTQAELDTQTIDAEIAAQEHNNNPTEKQKETGIYNKARISLQGHNITLETLKGQQRSGTDSNGKAWSITMNNHYGELDGTTGYDGDAIDVFVGPNPKSGQIFVIDQISNDGTFDESKVMLGFDTAEEAKAAYMSNYEEGWQGFGNITPAGDKFKQWLYDGAKQRKPYAEYKDTPEAVEMSDKIEPTSEIMSISEKLVNKQPLTTEEQSVYENADNKRMFNEAVGRIIVAKIEEDEKKQQAKKKSKKSKPETTTPQAQIQQILDNYEESVNMNMQEVIENIVTIAYDNDITEIQDAYKTYEDERREDREQWGERGDREAIENNFMNVVNRFMNNEQLPEALEKVDGNADTPESIKTKLLSELTLPKYIYDFFNSLKQSESSDYIFAVYGKGFTPFNGRKINEFFSYVRNAINNNDKIAKEILQDKGFDISNVEKVDYTRIWFKNGIFLSKTTGEKNSNANYFYAGTQVSIRDTKEYREIADQSVDANEMIEKPVEATSAPKYKNGDTVYYKGKQYIVNGIYNGVLAYDLETSAGKLAFEEVEESELSKQAPASRLILDVAVEQHKKNEEKAAQQPKEVDVAGIFNSLNKKGEAKLSENIVPDKVSAAQAEADAALQDFLDAFNDLNSDNLGIVDNTAEKQAKMLVAGTKMVGAYTKLGVYKFADLVSKLAEKGIQITEDLLSAIKKSYGAFAAENDIDELDDMKTVRSFTLSDIKQKNNEDLTPKTNNLPKNDVSLTDQKFIKEHVIFGTIPKTNDNGNSKPNSRTADRKPESNRGGLSLFDEVDGQRTSTENIAGNSKGEQLQPGNGSSESGNRPQYDVNKTYTNEEISEIVSSVTTIKNGKIEITGEVTEDIKTIASRYVSGGVAKQGRGILDEYYTDSKIVDAVTRIITKLIPSGTVKRALEPSVGTGNFIQAIPTSAEIVGFEINETTARIAKIFNPTVEVNLRSFETEFIDDSGKKKPITRKYNLVVGNPPYGEHRGMYKGLGEESKITKYEDYFVKRSLDVLEEGGVLAMVLPSSWMDRHKTESGYTIEVAYRLPSGAFEATQVGTDIVVLRKNAAHTSSEPHNYFQNNPENVLGEIKERSNRFGKMEQYVAGDIDAALAMIDQNEARKVANDLQIEATADNVNDIAESIEETGSPEKTKKVVKASKQTKTATVITGKVEIKKGTLKYNLNKGDEVVPASSQFPNEFSPEQEAAFKDCNYSGIIPKSKYEQHKQFVNFYNFDWVHDFYYAEGNIYEKLEQLERDKPNMAQAQYDKQKQMLRSVLPEIKTLDKVSISPNTEFVKNLSISTDKSNSGTMSLKDLFEDFVRKLPRESFGNSSSWEVIDYVENRQVYGQDKERNALVRERRKAAANDLFKKFLTDEVSAAERSQIEYAFNREYNAMYRPDYSKVPMFSSINKNFKGRPLQLTIVQRAGIGRSTVKGVGILAHEVGFGKTLSGILAVHEAMTRGTAKKPLIVVPNDSILKQWVETIHEVLPQSTVNVLGNLGVDYDLTNFAVNDSEITLVTYEGFKAMGFKDETYDKLAQDFNYITDDLKAHKSERDRQKEKAKQDETKGKMRKKVAYNFEDFGFDFMTFDEVHNANHIVGKVKLDKKDASDFRSQSQRTSDLGIKTWLASQYIQQNNNGRNVLLLSATPFTNKPLEYYSILSLVGNSTLKRMGFYKVDQFFETFMEADNDIEIKADGTPAQKTNVRRFKNNGLFNQLLSEFIDIKGEDDNPDLVRPERHNREYKIPQNDLTAETISNIQDLFKNNEDVLKGITHSRLVAFSPYASSYSYATPKNYKQFVENSPKIHTALKLIAQNKKDNSGAGQLMYSEIGVEFFPMIQEYLIKEVGYNANEVRIISGATSLTERANIQNGFNKGEIKVIIGSPAIKEGINLQENTTDMYILSLPYNFTQLRQVEGRSWRQGNKWSNIRVNYMLTDNSVDVFLLQRLQIKQGLYNESMKSGAETVDVSDIDTSELKTALITDPTTRANIELMIERGRLEAEKTRITSDLAFIHRKFEKYNELKKKINTEITSLQQREKWAETDTWWARNLDGARKQVETLKAEIENEKQKLAEKGVNVDDIVSQETNATNQIAEINKKIEALKERLNELIVKYTAENIAKAKIEGDVVSRYIKERAQENKGDFYTKRIADPQFQAVSPIGFYSTVEKALEAIQQERGTKDQFRAMLLKNGAKQAEMDWMGFDELPEKLTKADIQNWIDENRIEVQEVEKNQSDKKRTIRIATPDELAEFDSDWEVGEWAENNMPEAIQEDGYPDYNMISESEMWFSDGNGQIGTDRERVEYNSETIEGDIKYSQYQLPGGDNYKELLLTMPAKYRYEVKKDGVRFRIWDNDKNDWAKYKTGFDFTSYLNKVDADYLVEDLNKKNGNSNFRSFHFDEPNILAHVRFNERTVNGERVLFIEEIQSDWAQEGKKKGFAGKLIDTNLNYIDYRTQLWEKYNVESVEELTGKATQNEIDTLAYLWSKESNTTGTISNSVPDMPFRKTDQWVNLAARRMIRYAAENGFDRIAWTTGEQQADRYNLAKQVDRIVVDEDGGKYTVMARPLGKTDLEEITVATKENLSDYIGKELATKAINDGGGDFSGDDLKVGGSGMKAFYDAIVPSAMSKLGKPFGSKVENVEIKNIDINTFEENPTFTVQSIPVTDSMKQTSMAGMPLYHTGTTMQPTTPEEVAATVEQLLKTGLAKEVRMVTPEEIAGMLDGAETLLRTPTGTIYGFVKNGIVYINSNTPNLNTPIHEFGHLWIDAIEGSDLYNRGAELVKETPYWERVNADTNYSHLSENARAKEAMAMAIGDKGEAVKRNIGLFARIKVWIADVWTRIGSKFGIQNLTPEQIQNLTFNDFVEVAVSELMSGENLAERNKNTNFETPKNNNGSNEKTRLDNRRTMASEPERLPLGTLTSSNAVGKTIAGTTTTNPRTGRTADAKSQSEHWNKSKGLKQLAAQAKADGTWIEDISTLTDGKVHFANGTENNVYRSKDGHKVIKVNNLLFLNENDLEFAYTRDLNYFFDRISAHNTLFPEDAYNIVGFTENEAGQVCIVMEQPYISSNVHPTIEEIEPDLSKRGFTKTTLGEGINQGLTGYTNGIYELTDVKPLNVLKDENGNMHYIDLDISKTIQPSTPEKPTFKGDLGEYAFQVVEYNDQQAERTERISKMQRLQEIMVAKSTLAARHRKGEVNNQEYAKQMLALHEERQRVMKGLPDPDPTDEGPDDSDPKPTRTIGQSISEYATAVADWNYRQTIAKALDKTASSITGGLPPVDDDTDISGDMIRAELDQRLGGFFGRLAEGWQDNIRSVRIFLDLLREKGTKVSDFNNFYMQYTAIQGKNDAHLKDFGKRFMEAINANVLNIQKYTNYEYRDVENYVFLKHGIERNEYMRAQAAAEAVNEKLPPLTKEQIEGDIDGSLQDEYKAAYDQFMEEETAKVADKDYSGLFAVAAEIWAKQNGEAFNPKKKGDVARIQKMDEFKSERDAVIVEYIAKFEKTIADTIIPTNKKGEQLTIEGFWAAINSATNYSLDRLVSSGIESKEDVDDLKARYQYYVPLRGHEVEAEKIWHYEAPDNKNVVSKAIMQASGRGSRAEHPFAYIIQMAQTSINKANRNQLNQTILRLARLDKSGLMSVSETWYVLTGTDPDTGKEIWTETEPDFSEDHEIRVGEIRAWNEKMTKLEEEGKARRFRKGLRIGGLFIKPKQKRQHAITIFEDGISYQVYINGNPRVSQAINELNGTKWNFPLLTPITRFISAMITSRSPQFMLTNGARDLAFASSILPSKEGGRYTAQFLKNYPIAIAILANDATFDMGSEKARYKKYLKEFEMNGGETGYSHLLELQDIQKDLYKKQKGKNYLNPKTDIDAIISIIDGGNKVIENSTRLATYITSRENGRSIERSVSDSKEVTLNFNRRGSGIMGAAHVQSLFMFVNAGVQALANFGHVYKMHPAKMSATIGAYAAVGFLMPMIINAIGGDDDEKEYMNMTDWERQTNLCLPTGGGFAKIPLPQEMRIFFKLGDEVYKLYSGRTEASETAITTLLSAADMIPISPLGTVASGEINDFGDLQRAISPDGLRGVAELATNTNFMGGQIYDKYKAEKEGLPGYQKARLNRVGEPRAPESIVGFTRWLDHFTGGDGVKKGGISWNPDIVNHLAKSYFGGMYSLVAEGEKSFTKRFYTSNADIEEKNTTVRDYYKRIRDAEEVIRQDKGYQEQLEKGEISEEAYNRAIPASVIEKAYMLRDYGNEITKIERILKTGELTADDELYYKHMSDSLKQEVIRIK